jgi:hypothetical protein
VLLRSVEFHACKNLSFWLYLLADLPCDTLGWQRRVANDTAGALSLDGLISQHGEVFFRAMNTGTCSPYDQNYATKRVILL